MDFIMKCANVAFSVVLRKGDGDAENWTNTVFCFGIRLVPYAVFSTRIYLQYIARPVESNRPINIVFVLRPAVRLIKAFAVCMKKPWVLSYPLIAHQRLIRLGECPGWSESSLDAQVVLLVLSCCGSFIIFWFVSLASTILISVISMLFISRNSPRKRWYLCIHARVYLFPLIMSYCRWVVVLTFIFHNGRRVTNGHRSVHRLLVGPGREVRVVSLMVNGYADIYKDSRRNHLRHKG